MTGSNYRKALRHMARRDGWHIQPTRGGHYRLDHPEASKPVFAAKSPRDSKVLLHIAKDMRRALAGDPGFSRGEGERA
jgi:predicted RNA binding protein YcfA (HicA-like mRNA interferase family)